MATIGQSAKLLREIVRFAVANKVYWLIPLMLVLGIAAGWWWLPRARRR